MATESDKILMLNPTEVWNAPATENPQLEPVFTSAMHGIEISFLLLADFVTDNRS